MAVNPTLPNIDAEFIEQVQQFSLRVTQAGKGGRLAEQKTTAKGQGLEFADYKPYAIGDDLRAIDWHVYRRLDRLFVRVFEEQQNLPVYILLDHSSSMFVESPARIQAAKQCALALGAIALNQQDSVRVLPFSSKLSIQNKPLSGNHQLFNLSEQLEQQQAVNDSNIGSSILEFSSYPLRQGLVVVVSDFFDSQGIKPIIDALSLVRHKLLLIQVTQPWDADPELLNIGGDIRFEDSETATTLDLQLTPTILKEYHQSYNNFNNYINQFVQESGAELLQLNASDTVLPQLSSLFEKGVMGS